MHTKTVQKTFVRFYFPPQAENQFKNIMFSIKNIVFPKREDYVFEKREKV
jgi:hypothetical protein